MVVSYFVRYEGEPESLRLFVSYYAANHVPILRRFPEIVDVILHVPLASPDPMPTNAGRAFFMAQMLFSSREALSRALSSDERLAARADMGCFPKFQGTVSHQAFSTYRTLQGDIAAVVAN